MTAPASDGLPPLSGYQLRLPAYEGPLDVLLRLIERSQLAIEDVSLVAVTHQFLAFVERLEEASPEVVADFTAVGARLTMLKSRSLLPRPAAPEDEVVESDLADQLREYKQVKMLATYLQEAARAGTVSYPGIGGGAVERLHGGTTVKLAHHDASSLVRSLRRRLSVVPRPATLVRQRPRLTLRELVTHVGDCVDRLVQVRFSAVIQDYHGRSEVATAFLAVLVLVRRESIAVSQRDAFSEIELSQQVGQASRETLPALDDARLFSYGSDDSG